MNKYKALIDDYNKKKAKRTGIPGNLHFSVQPIGSEGISVNVRVAKNGGGTGLRLVDSWLMAIVHEIDVLGAGRIVRSIEVELSHVPDTPTMTSFVRRMSYLAINNEWEAQLSTPGGLVPLVEDSKVLFKPEQDEIVRPTWGGRTDNTDQDGAVEKMLQTWLAGSARKTNDRLAILGEDFTPGTKGSVRVEREVPTGSFRGRISKSNYILPKYWIDLITLNKWGKLALIELKVTDSKLEAMAQLLDYALFFRVHRDDLTPIFNKKLQADLKPRADFVCYIANNRFHPRFDDIGRYYQPREIKGAGFLFKKLVMGSTSVLT